MKTKRLSEFNLDKCIYMAVGIHAEEPIESIIDRKVKETEDYGFSLWAYSNPKAKCVRPFCGDAEYIYVLMCVKGKPTVGSVREATYYEDKLIPTEMKVTFSGRRDAQALVVEEYYKINESDNCWNKADYVRLEYFNGFELLEKQESGKTNLYVISYIAKLKAPFSVGIR